MLVLVLVQVWGVTWEPPPCENATRCVSACTRSPYVQLLWQHTLAPLIVSCATYLVQHHGGPLCVQYIKAGTHTLDSGLHPSSCMHTCGPLLYQHIRS